RSPKAAFLASDRWDPTLCRFSSIAKCQASLPREGLQLLPPKEAAMSATITPFSIAIPDSQLAALRARLAMTVLPGEIAGAGWSQGPTEAFIAANLAYLQNGFDWRRAEAA